MPKQPYIQVPDTFLPRRGFHRELTPNEFLHYYYGLCRAISAAKTDIQTIMHFRGWRAHGASSGPECVMRKTFPAGRAIATSDKIAPEIEAHLCSILEAQPAPPKPAPPPSPRRRRKS
jgi:hypothetical protein